MTLAGLIHESTIAMLYLFFDYATPAETMIRQFAVPLIIVVGDFAFLQFLFGAYVAGLDAGYAYSSWPKMARARSRWTARRMWLTSGRSTRPEATIHQPIAPCRAPSASRPPSFQP